ncbi:galactosyldiacylglycerol synthase [Krasilnikovia sp. MM14-A1259]
MPGSYTHVAGPGDRSGHDRPRIMIVSASIGAGHDGAADVIGRQMDALGFAVDRCDFLELLPPRWGARLRDGYASQLRYAPATWGWLLHAVAGRRCAQGAAAWSYVAAASRMRAAIQPATAAVVSTYPLASQVLGRLRRTGQLAAPVAAVMTDPSVHPLCVAGGVDVHLAASRHAAAAVMALGGTAATVGPIVNPAFRSGRHPDEGAAARQRLGLPAHSPLAVVVAGSWGVGDIDATARDIAATGTMLPVVVCGRNDALRRRLAASAATLALGWVDDMPSLLRVADVVVHNAGALSSLEAMASGVPVVSYRCLPGHGVANAAVLEELGLSLWPRNPRDLTAALAAAVHGDLRTRQHQAYRQLCAAPGAATVVAGLAAGHPLVRRGAAVCA